MTPQEIENDRLMHHHAHQCCQLPCLEARRTFLYEIGDKYGADWKSEVERRVEVKWPKELRKRLTRATADL